MQNATCSATVKLLLDVLDVETHIHTNTHTLNFVHVSLQCALTTLA